MRGEVREERGEGELRRTLPSRRADRPVGQWNRLEVGVRGGRLEARVNGVLVQVGEVARTGGASRELGLGPGARLLVRGVFVR